MADRRIVWTSSAKLQLIAILEYFNFRNKAKHIHRDYTN